MTSDPFASVVGQHTAVAALRAAAAAPVHAYMLEGPRGAGARTAARAFAAEVLAAGLEGDERERVLRLAVEGNHVDLVEIEPDGLVWRFPQRSSGESPGSRLVQEATTSPREAARKVVVAVDFHLANLEAVGKLLKIVEEPPPTTVLVLLEDEVPPEQVTIASRCVRFELGPVPASEVVAHLESRGVDLEAARLVAEVAAGDVARAELLASDPGLQARMAAWSSVPARLDGRGATVHGMVGELRAHLDEAAAAVTRRHEEETEAVRAEAESRGTTRGMGLTQLGQRHKREMRLLRTEELRSGLAALGGTYRQVLVATGAVRGPDRTGEALASLSTIQVAAEALEHNPGEELWLAHLLLGLSPLPVDAAEVPVPSSR